VTDADDDAGSDAAAAEAEDDEGGGEPETPDDAAPEAAEAAPLPEDLPFALADLYDAIESLGRPVVTAAEVARTLDCTQEEADRALSAFADADDVGRVDVSGDPVVWYPTDWGALADRERVILFPERHELIVDQPSQFTRAQLSTFAHLVDTTRSGGYMYEIRREDIWHAPHDTFEDLMRTVNQVLPEQNDHLTEWIETQWTRARQFRLYTHEDGYVVLAAASDDLMGNVARQKLDDDQLRAPIGDDEAWVAEGEEASVKRTLYEAGYPVQDERELDSGEPLHFDLRLQLRGYQESWVDDFMQTSAGVFVGPSGSGKTVAAMGVMERVGGETLILVPGRELAHQWHEELLAHTTLEEDQVGEYHGGTKQIRPVTIATYRTAAMDRHRELFDTREWGLLVLDEAHHIPAPVFRRAADLQSRHRLGLSATPVRESDDEEDIYTLIGPPIGTDWDALFEAGFVQEPEVEIRYVPWDSEMARNEFTSTHGNERRQAAATNPAKVEEVRHLLAKHRHRKALVFVDYLDQGEAMAESLSVPFISGEMPHSRRQKLFQEFRDGTRDTLVISRVGDEGIDLPDAELAIVASGLGGSRRQGSQRAGRTMRPEGESLMYVLATRGTTEEEFAQRRMQHLSSKGVRVREAEAEAVERADP
jgi:DNA excision repair protein ERCC-3